MAHLISQFDFPSMAVFMQDLVRCPWDCEEHTEVLLGHGGSFNYDFCIIKQGSGYYKFQTFLLDRAEAMQIGFLF